MRNVDANFLTALTTARDVGIVPRTFVYLKCKRRDDGTPVEFGYWNGGEDIQIAVTSGETGATVTRTYLAGGELLEVSDITLSADLTVQQVEIALSQLSPATLSAVFEHDVRFAKVEIHEMTLDVATRSPSAQPPCVFYGEVDGAPVNIPAVDGEGSITLKAVSDAITMLTRVNTARSSYNQQKRRDGDEWGKYGNVVRNWDVSWGEKD